MNIFYTSSLISLIVANALIDKEFKGKKNVLIIEHDITKVIPKIQSGHDINYDKMLDIISRCAAWSEVHHVYVENLFISFKGLNWPISILPIEHLRIIKNKEKPLIEIENLLQTLTSKDKLFVSDNAILWRYFYKKQSFYIRGQTIDE